MKLGYSTLKIVIDEVSDGLKKFWQVSTVIDGEEKYPFATFENRDEAIKFQGKFSAFISGYKTLIECKKDCPSFKSVADADEMFYCQPVKRDKFNRRVEEYTRRDWFMKIIEEVFETFEATDIQRHTEELIDIITVCTSYLEALGFDEEARGELFRQVNEKNRKRGYMED